MTLLRAAAVTSASSRAFAASNIHARVATNEVGACGFERYWRSSVESTDRWKMGGIPPNLEELLTPLKKMGGNGCLIT